MLRMRRAAVLGGSDSYNYKILVLQLIWQNIIPCSGRVFSRPVIVEKNML